MFGFILENGLAKRVISKFVTKLINEKIDVDGTAKFNDIRITAKNDSDTVYVHLDLDLTANKDKLLMFLNDKM